MCVIDVCEVVKSFDALVLVSSTSQKDKYYLVLHHDILGSLDFHIHFQAG